MTDNQFIGAFFGVFLIVGIISIFANQIPRWYYDWRLRRIIERDRQGRAL